MSTSVPKFWSVRFHDGPLSLCRACYAVLVQEGALAGDPREPALEAAHVLRANPCASSTYCDACESLKRYELHRPALQAPPARLAFFGALTPEEREGNDTPQQEQGAWDSYHADSDLPHVCPERCDAPACRESCAG